MLKTYLSKDKMCSPGSFRERQMKRKNSFRNNTSRWPIDTVLLQKCRRIYFLIVQQVSLRYIIKWKFTFFQCSFMFLEDISLLLWSLHFFNVVVFPTYSYKREIMLVCYKCKTVFQYKKISSFIEITSISNKNSCALEVP